MTAPTGGVTDSDARGRRTAALAALVAAVSFLPSLAASFVYDDLGLIVENPYARSLTYLFRGFRTHLWDVFAYGASGFGLRYYRPIVSASYVLNWVVSGGAPWAFHLVNVLSHAAATFLAARAALRWTEDARLGLLAALVFGLHPTRTESVIWVSGRTDVFMALFLLAAVELTRAAARSEARRSAALTGAAFAAFALAVLSKEAAAATALLVAVDWLLADAKSPEKKRLFVHMVLFAALGVLYVGARSTFYPVSKGRPFELTPAYGFFTTWAYFERVVFPWPQTFFYRPAVEVGGVPHFDPLVVALGVALAVSFVGLLVFAYRRDRPSFLLILGGAIFLGPLLNFSYTGIYVTTSDHFLYFPLLLLIAGSLRLFRRRLAVLFDVRAFRLAAGGVLVLCAAVDVIRVLDYRDDATFWNHEIEVNPENPVALTELSRMAARAGDPEAAFALIQKADAPASRRFFLLAGERGARIVTRARRLALDATLRADGDVAALESIFDELRHLLAMCRSEYGEPLGFAGALKIASQNGQVAAIVSDAALVGTRIGRTEDAATLANALSGQAVFRSSNPLNLVLVYGRLGEFGRARRTLSVVEKPPSGIGPFGSREEFDELRRRLGDAEALLVRTRNEPDDRARVDAATAYADLGAYLSALRALRPAFDHTKASPGVAPLYVQLLVSARLDDEALATAESLLGPERGPRVIDELRAQLPPRVRAQKKPPEPSPWWTG